MAKKKSKMIGGIRHTFVFSTTRKRDAQRGAANNRRDGINARIIKTKAGYEVWRGNKSKHTHCGYCGKRTRKGYGMCKSCYFEH